jgi:hypothetical protein
MPTTFSIDDTGFIDVTINGQCVHLDLWQVNNNLYEIGRAHQDKPAAEYFAAVCDHLETLGFPRVSHWAADQFVSHITEAVNALKKGVEGASTPDSPASTASAPSA